MFLTGGFLKVSHCIEHDPTMKWDTYGIDFLDFYGIDLGFI